MPLTCSHPAIILPIHWLGKRRVSLTGLAAGSVAPDFEYFFRMRVLSIYSHTWLGLLWFNVPVGLLICFVYHNMVRNCMIKNLPNILYKRFEQFNHFDWNGYFKNHFLIVVLSVTIGAASHLFWDSFTHLTGYFVIRWQMFTPIQFLNVNMPLYKLIQHMSTFIGGITIVIAIVQMPKQRVNNHVTPLYWATFSSIIAMVTLTRLLTGIGVYEYWNILVTAISAAILGIVITPVFMKFNHST